MTVEHRAFDANTTHLELRTSKNVKS